MYEFGDITEDDVVEIMNNITTTIRNFQRDKSAIDYDSIMKELTQKFGADNQDVKDIAALIYNLRDTNPYV